MPKRKIIISERDNIATLFEDDRAVEFIIHRGNMLLGDVYLAEVENILPSIDAGFVNVGGDKMGFLHSSDVQGKGDLKKRLTPKQRLVVQVMKEPTGHKGPRVTTNITMPGRFLVLLPQSKGISISRKIEEAAERHRLKSIVSLVKPAGVGVIIRTEANGQKEEDLQEDFEVLLERWQNIVALADTSNPPTLLYRDQDLLYRVVRENVNEDIEELIVDTHFGFQRAQQLLQNWNLDKNIRVHHYTGNQSMMSAMGVDREIRQALQTKVPLPSGGYLYIQTTEALTVVDVNSGKFTSLQSQAETIRITNLESTKEIARQLRLRNIGGMIVVDFIDMESRADQLSILEAFERELAPDKSKPQIGQLSDLGLVEMTRHRQGQALSEIFTRKCQHCSGTGHALDEMAWATPGMGMDLRSTDPRQQRGGRFGNRQQQGRGGYQQRGGAGGASGSASGNTVPQPRTQAPGGFIKPGMPGGGRPQPGGAVAAGAHASGAPAGGRGAIPTGAPVSPQAAQIVSQMTQPEPVRRNVPGKPGAGALEKPIDEYLREKVMQMGLRFSDVVKLAYTPPETNNLLSRINPRCNDIITLVNTIEDPSSSYGGMSDDVGENGEGLELDLDELTPVGRGMLSREMDADDSDADDAMGPSAFPVGEGSQDDASDEDLSEEADEDAETGAPAKKPMTLKMPPGKRARHGAKHGKRPVKKPVAAEGALEADETAEDLAESLTEASDGKPRRGRGRSSAPAAAAAARRGKLLEADPIGVAEPASEEDSDAEAVTAGLAKRGRRTAALPESEE